MTVSETSTVSEFWHDSPKWPDDQRFLIREFQDKPNIPWIRRNKGIARELFFFAALLTVGILIISYNWNIMNRYEFLASVFFVSGLIPLIQSVMFDILPRIVLKRGSIELEDTLSGIMSACFLIAALVIYPKPIEAEDQWSIVCGKTLFEAGLIYFITRVLFFIPNPSDEIRKLKKDNKELKESMAIGLADGYFWNLVREIAIDIRDANGPDGALRLVYSKDEQTYKIVENFIILVPRKLEWSEDDPIASKINTLKGMGTFRDCKIEKSHARADSSRFKWVTDVIGMNGSTCVLVDVPTTLTALFMKLKSSSYQPDSPIVLAKFQHEISVFSLRIAWQLKKLGLDKYVKVVEIEDLNELLDTIQDISTQISSNKIGVSA